MVAFDPDRDLAVLQRAPTSTGPPSAASTSRRARSAPCSATPVAGPLRAAPFEVGRRSTPPAPTSTTTSARERKVLILSADLAPGDSGAALIDPQGRVVGVAFAIAPDSRAWPTRSTSRSSSPSWPATSPTRSTPAPASADSTASGHPGTPTAPPCPQLARRAIGRPAHVGRRSTAQRWRPGACGESSVAVAPTGAGPAPQLALAPVMAPSVSHVAKRSAHRCNLRQRRSS